MFAFLSHTTSQLAVSLGQSLFDGRGQIHSLRSSSRIQLRLRLLIERVTRDSDGTRQALTSKIFLKNSFVDRTASFGNNSNAVFPKPFRLRGFAPYCRSRALCFCFSSMHAKCNAVLPFAFSCCTSMFGSAPLRSSADNTVGWFSRTEYISAV